MLICYSLLIQHEEQQTKIILSLARNRGAIPIPDSFSSIPRSSGAPYYTPGENNPGPPAPPRAGRDGRAGKAGKRTRNDQHSDQMESGKIGSVCFCVYGERGLLESAGYPYHLAFANGRLEPRSCMYGGQPAGEVAFVFGQTVRFGPCKPINTGKLASPPSTLKCVLAVWGRSPVTGRYAARPVPIAVAVYIHAASIESSCVGPSVLV